MMINESLPIDPSLLDEEWLNQPLLFDEAQQEAADCMKKRDDLKDKLLFLEADRSAYLRSAWSKEGFDKPPAQQAVTDWVLLRPEIEVIKAELNEAQYKLNIANNTVKSLDMRKSALAKLTDLWISNYYSVPNENRLLAAGKRFIIERPDQSKEQSEKALENLNEKKRKRKEEVKEKMGTEANKEELDKRVEDEIEKDNEEVKERVSRRRRR